MKKGMSMTDTNTYCEGCYSYFPTKQRDGDGILSNGCIHKQYNKGQCPCSECIIKVMCNNPCEKYVNFNPTRSWMGRYDR